MSSSIDRLMFGVEGKDMVTGADHAGGGRRSQKVERLLDGVACLGKLSPLSYGDNWDEISPARVKPWGVGVVRCVSRRGYKAPTRVT